MIQVEGLKLVPFSSATVADDRRLFSSTEWSTAIPKGNMIMGGDRASAEEMELASSCQRLAFYYLRKWKSELSEDNWVHGEVHHQRLRDSANHLLSLIMSGRHPTMKKEWVTDTEDDINALTVRYFAIVNRTSSTH